MIYHPMSKNRCAVLAACLAAFCALGVAQWADAEVIAYQGFEGESGPNVVGYTLDIYGSATEDDWRTATATDLALTNLSPSGLEGTHFFGAVGGLGQVDHALTFDAVDVSAYDEIKISVLLGAARGQFEQEDYLAISISVDGAPFEQWLEFRPDYPPYNYSGIATKDLLVWNPLALRETGLDDVFAEFTYDGVPDGASTVAVRFDAENNSGGEEFGFDNFRITGVVPEPSSSALLFLGALAMLCRGRRR